MNQNDLHDLYFLKKLVQRHEKEGAGIMLQSDFKRYTECLSRVEKDIMQCADIEIRLILTLRYIDCHSWREIAQFIGRNSSEDSVRKKCFRYLNAKKGT